MFSRYSEIVRSYLDDISALLAVIIWSLLAEYLKIFFNRIFKWRVLINSMTMYTGILYMYQKSETKTSGICFGENVDFPKPYVAVAGVLVYTNKISLYATSTIDRLVKWFGDISVIFCEILIKYYTLGSNWLTRSL